MQDPPATSLIQTKAAARLISLQTREAYNTKENTAVEVQSHYFIALPCKCFRR